MIDILIKKIPETEHGIFGLGSVRITYRNDGNHRLKIEFEKLPRPIEYVDEFAEKMADKIFHNRTENETILKVKKIAASVCNTTVEKMQLGTRNSDDVQARFLVFWYAKRRMGYSLAYAGALYNQDHATALNGIRYIEKDDKYKKTEHVNYHNDFFKQIKERGL